MTFNRHTKSTIGLTSVVTAVMWLVFATGGVAGLRLQYQQAQARAKEIPPVTAEKMDVRLIGTAAANAAAPAVESNSSPAPPAMPSLLPVLAPSPEIPFAVPVNAPLQKAQIGPPVQHLVFGTGEGDKPPPEYPSEAKLAHQQGTVVVRFTTDENGHVIDAQASVPSPCPLLNEAAVRAVRETWDDFPKGKFHTYDISFQFELHQK
jgi:TonB family protein